MKIDFILEIKIHFTALNTLCPVLNLLPFSSATDTANLVVQIARTLRDNLGHCLVELSVADHVISIRIDFSHYLLPQSLIAIVQSGSADSTMEYSAQFLDADLSIAISVKQIECNAQVFLIEQTRPIHSSRDELAIINLSILIGVQLVDQIVPVLGTGSHEAQHLIHSI